MRAREKGSSPGRVEGSSRAMLATARPSSFLSPPILQVDDGATAGFVAGDWCAGDNDGHEEGSRQRDGQGEQSRRTVGDVQHDDRQPQANHGSVRANANSHRPPVASSQFGWGGVSWMCDVSGGS